MIEKDELTLRLEGIGAAQQRSRNAFLSATVASLVVLIVFFNLTFSQGSATPTMPDHPPTDVVFEALKKEQVKHFFDRFYYSLPLVGVQVSTDDLVLFAPLGMLIFSLYYVSCVRNSYKQIDDLRGSLDERSDRNDLIKVNIVLRSEIVLNEPSSELPFTIPLPAWLFLDSLSKTINLYQLLIYLPALASVGALYADIHGTFFAGGPLDPAGTIYFNGLSAYDKFKVLSFEFVGASLTLVVILYCLAASRYANKTRSLVSSFNVDAGRVSSLRESD
jgi:hypothetical protein